MSLDTVRGFPLAWPFGWKRTPANFRRGGRFHRTVDRTAGDGMSSYKAKAEMTVAEGTKRVLGELRRFGCPDFDVVISSNLELRLDGMPKAGRAVDDPGVAVYWRDGAETRCIAVDAYMSVQDNLAAIAATIEAMRAIERHGGAQILARAFVGFAALPAPDAQRPWHQVLGVSHDERSFEVIRNQFRRKASEHHPDKVGPQSGDKMAEINRAWAQAQEALGVSP